MRVLYQFPLSHYCEKARWLLDHKELDYVAHNLIPGFHRAFTYFKSGQYLLPMLKDGKRWIADSTQIALYLDATYPEHTLLRRDEQLRDQAHAIKGIAANLGLPQCVCICSGMMQMTTFDLERDWRQQVEALTQALRHGEQALAARGSWKPAREEIP